MSRPPRRPVPPRHTVAVEIAGEKHVLRSDVPPEYTRRVADHVDATIRALPGFQTLEPFRAATLAALSITDELFRARDEIRRLRGEIDGKTRELAELLEAAEAAAAEKRPVRRPAAGSAAAWLGDAPRADAARSPSPSVVAPPPLPEDDAPRLALDAPPPKRDQVPRAVEPPPIPLEGFRSLEPRPISREDAPRPAEARPVPRDDSPRLPIEPPPLPRDAAPPPPHTTSSADAGTETNPVPAWSEDDPPRADDGPPPLPTAAGREDAELMLPPPLPGHHHGGEPEEERDEGV